LKIHRTIILLIVLYGCETWSLTLGDEHRLRDFENRVLRRMFWPRWDGVRGKWVKLHIEELHDLYSSTNNIRVIKSGRLRWGGGNVTNIWARRSAYMLLMSKNEGKRPHGGPRPRWDENIRFDLQEVG